MGLRNREGHEFHSCRYAILNKNAASAAEVRAENTLSSRPEPERQRRRSGGTCCSLSAKNALSSWRALCAEGSLHSYSRPRRLRESSPRRRSVEEVTSGRARVPLVPISALKKDAASAAEVSAENALSSRPEPERQRRQSGGTCCPVTAKTHCHPEARPLRRRTPAPSPAFKPPQGVLPAPRGTKKPGRARVHSCRTSAKKEHGFSRWGARSERQDVGRGTPPFQGRRMATRPLDVNGCNGLFSTARKEHNTAAQGVAA